VSAAGKPLGRALRPLFELDPEGTFLNHGSFGACPKEVLAEQARIRAQMEAQPDVFFRQSVMPEQGVTALRTAASRLAAFVGTHEAHVAFVENATLGVQAALGSVDLGPGERVLVTDHTYNAVRLMVEARCAQAGATPVVVKLPLPADPDEIVESFERALAPGVKLAIVDHITSPTALVMPLERIIPALRRSGALVLVDGAHAVGQVALDLERLQPDWYVSNAHKWLFAPRASALLYASASVAAATRPPVISHFVGMGFPRSFDWVGTRDYSAWLTAPAAIRFHQGFDTAAVRDHHRGVLDAATAALAGVGAEPVGPIGLCAAMRSFVLPQRRPATREDALALARALWDEERIQAMAVALGERLLLRVSSQVYVDAQDATRLGEALGRRGWPGR
jgi:isopenicillin-N epimerase